MIHAILITGLFLGNPVATATGILSQKTHNVDVPPILGGHLIHHNAPLFRVRHHSPLFRVPHCNALSVLHVDEKSVTRAEKR